MNGGAFFALVMGCGIFGGAGAWFVMRIGPQVGLLDRPRARSSHWVETPKGGAIGILAAFCLTAGWSGFPSLIWLSAAGLALVSLLGDRIELSPKLRLVLQFVAAGVASCQIAAIFPGLAGWHISGLPLGVLFSVLFMVATANVYNFMDGINGIAGITGIVALGLLAITGWIRGESRAWVLVASALAAACAGFLPWNYPKARVFMGDVGSILLGFVFAVFVVAWSRTLADFIMFAAFLLPFYADEVATLFIRLKDRDSLIKPHRRHIYQILANQMGIAHWKISLGYGCIQLGLAATAFLVHFLGWMAQGIFVLFSLAGLLSYACHIRNYESRANPLEDSNH